VDRSYIEGWEYFLETLQLSKVDVLKFATAENGKPGYYPIEQIQDQKKLLSTPGIEFKFSGGPFAPFMKIEVEKEQGLLLKYFRDMETDEKRKGSNGGLLLLWPQFTISTGNDWLRHIVISTENNNFTLVFGDNPTQQKEGGNRFAISYKREIRREVMRVPYSNLNP
jgi:hypothetical protein